MKITARHQNKMLLKLNTLATVLLAIVFSMGACTTDKLSAPPTIKVFVNNDDLTDASTVFFPMGTRVQYQFVVEAKTTITSVRTVVFDVSIPTKKTAKEVLVGGLPIALTDTIKGTLVTSTDTEIMLVVKDVDGNEVSKSFTAIVQ